MVEEVLNRGEMMKFRKKPVVIEAVQWTGNNVDEILDFGDTGPQPLWGDDFQISDDTKQVEILTLEGKMFGDVGDWIIRGVKGEFYACKNDIFEMTYEKVE
jgi:hypothetical protein